MPLQRGILLGRWQLAVQRHHQQVVLARERFQLTSHLTNLTLSRQKDEDVARHAQQSLHRASNCDSPRHAFPAWFVRDFDREQPTFAGDDRSVSQKLRHRFDAERRRHHDHFEIGPHCLLNSADHAQRQIGVEAPLVKFIEDHHRDRIQKRIVLQHPHERPFGHDQDARPLTPLPIKSHLIADFVAELSASFKRHAPSGGPRGDSSRFEHDHTP